MNVIHKWEPVFIALALIGAEYLIDQWPASLSAGHFILLLCTIFFVQTLLRDLVLILRARMKPRQNHRPREGPCFCLESGLGVVVLMLGILLLLTDTGGQVQLSHNQWRGSLAGLLLLNYGLRDYVFSWNPWQIYRDPDHQNIIPKW